MLGNEEEEEEDDVIQQYVPPVAKDWLSFGSEKEIEDEAVVEHRKSVCTELHNFVKNELVLYTDVSIFCLGQFIIKTRS